jgi:hypothetical protein
MSDISLFFGFVSVGICWGITNAFMEKATKLPKSTPPTSETELLREQLLPLEERKDNSKLGDYTYEE